MTAQKSYLFHVSGMHCRACTMLLDKELIKHPKILSVKSSLTNHSVEIYGNFGDMTIDEIATELNRITSQYKLSSKKPERKINWKEFYIAIPIAAGFVFLFLVLQKLGIVNLINANNITYGTAFAIGIIASLSTCMAVVGGLLLSMSATFAREDDKVYPQLLFHIARLIAFFMFGGVIGMAGSIFQLGANGTFALNIIIGLVMLILGLNLLDIFHWTKRFQPSTPKFLSSQTFNLTKINHTLTPILVGILTFFLPCGFTQSMQIYTLSTGNFLQGGLTMLFFALGTLPILALISFSSFTIKDSSKNNIFFKTAGLIVMIFAIFNLLNSFAAIGLIEPILNF
ncbi:MAG: sulfite exporter TauE/SafE family protein [Patescibacteria group bacterium]|nr:sulfite exporter TauE/SafE family protein [Patescibacteria group bacterium]